MTLLNTSQPNLNAQWKQHRDAIADHLLALAAPMPEASNSQPRLGSMPPSVQALVTAALASLYHHRRDPALGRDLSQALDTLWQDTPSSGLINTLPWLEMAESSLNHSPPATTQPQARDQRSRTLRQLAQAIRDRQVRQPPSQGPADNVGGFSKYSSDIPSAAADPDWRSAHLLAFLAVSLRDPELTRDQSLAQWVLDCGLAARFLTQLLFDQSNSFYIRSHDDAIGGVRLSVWDNRLATGSTAMALLAVTELQQSLLWFQHPRPPEAPSEAAPKSQGR